ncbi:gasdermin-B isoform X2 [Ursus maritimus]|uniref:Gasdermin-B isoform X2 n=1 Tax=Ursus maritimus TaxID=29073 RepID=A0A8M1GPD3_URSMA|nr:gasdermin-B isoform X2 [Ursus maritimus]
MYWREGRVKGYLICWLWAPRKLRGRLPALWQVIRRTRADLYLVAETPETVGSVLEQNWSEQPQGVGRDPDARLLCVLHVALSILLQLGEKLT